MMVSRYMRTQCKKSNLAKLILYKTAQGNVLNAARRLLYGISNRCKSLKVKHRSFLKTERPPMLLSVVFRNGSWVTDGR